MFCPNCGNNCGEANFCPKCGQNLRETTFSVPITPDVVPECHDMDFYFEKYGSDRNAAVAALRIETGMGAVDAIRTINQAFDARQGGCANSSYHEPERVHLSKREEFRAKKAELDATGQVYCPKCLSTSIAANKKGFGIGKAVVGAAAFKLIGLTAGNIGAKKVICTCLKCGYQWKAGKG